ncbi:hypothetical protein V6Z11_A03G156800 [Gossypium hirsutum]
MFAGPWKVNGQGSFHFRARRVDLQAECALRHVGAFLFVLLFFDPSLVWFTLPLYPLLIFSIPRDTHFQGVTFDYDLRPILFKTHLDYFSACYCFSRKIRKKPLDESPSKIIILPLLHF